MKSWANKPFRRELFRRYKARKGCSICGYNDGRALVFDHIDLSTKKYDISIMVSHSPASIKAEIAKCQILCQNCHTIKTLEEQDWKKKCHRE